MTSLYPQSFLSLKKGIRCDLLAAGSLYRVTRAGVQELLVSYKTERDVGISSLRWQSSLNKQGHLKARWLCHRLRCGHQFCVISGVI